MMIKFTDSILVIFLFSTGIFPNIINVPADQPNIQAGIDAAMQDDTVLVLSGIYYENINFKGKAITVASHFLMDHDTTNISVTIINGSFPTNPDSGSVVYFVSGEDTTSILCGFTITGGSGTLDPFPLRHGGGIVCSNSGAKIIHNYIENNHVTSSNGLAVGGGISAGVPGQTSWVIIDSNIVRNNSLIHTAFDWGANGGGMNVVINAKIRGNIIEYNLAQSVHQAAWGGGVLLGGNASQPLMRYFIGNRIRHNRALVPTGTFVDGGIGGGLVVSNVPAAIIKNNIISYNQVSSNTTLSNVYCWGGGVILQNQTDETLFAENTVSHNEALDSSICRGAGIAIWHFDNPGSPQIIKNIITDNTGGTYGGGLFIAGRVANGARLVNNTICDNSAVEGGAVYIGRDNYPVSHPKIENSILWNNGSSIHVNTGNVTVTYSDVQGGWTGDGNIDTDPLLHDSVMVNGDTMFCCLSSNSPCIDAGTPDLAYTDPEDPNNPGYALWPAMETLRNDMGRYGGPPDPYVSISRDDEIKILPSHFRLSQNYPNPFNPNTTIEFNLPRKGFVTLKIYNVLGEEIATLHSASLLAGSYRYEWDASGLASGVYIYQLKAEGYVATRKMILMK